MSWLADSFPTMTRHVTVLKAAWAAQNDNDRNAKPRTEHEFLPAALEIIEKPPSPGFRLLLLALCSLFAIALAWSFLGKVDVVAVATGKTLPQANVKIIQPMEIGAVRAIHVRNGQRVKKGDLLIELDPTIAGADEAAAGRGLLAARIAEERNAELLAHASGRQDRFEAPAGTPEDVAVTQRSLIRATIAQYEAEKGSLRHAQAEQKANLAASNAEIRKLQEVLPLIDQGLAKRQELTDKGYFSTIRLLDYEQQKVELVRNIDVQRANAARAQAAIGNLESQIAKLNATFAQNSSSELAKAQDESWVRREEFVKSARRREFQQLRAPVDGIVQQLSLSTIGGIVQPAQALMVIVPDDSAVIVEAYVQNKDIGFVREGQPVRVKLEAFPFTDYGLIEGTVEVLSRDAIERDLPSFQGSNPAKVSQQDSRMMTPGLVYAARIRLHQRHIRVAGKDQLIGSGMAVQAEIKTGERRIIDYLLSPIAKTMDEAGRER